MKAPGSIQPDSKTILRAWWKASRPPFYIATLIPLLLGFIMAGQDSGQWKAGLFALIMLASLFLHLAANLANDLFDYLCGTDKADTIGGSRGIQEGFITIRQYKVALVLLYGGAFLMGALGVAHTGLQGIWGIIIFASLVSFFYVAPPIRFGYRALGEVFVFLSMGLTMVAGTYYTLTGVWSAHTFAVATPVGLMVAGILYFQSMPEIETDKAAGKHTLANVLGPVWSAHVYRVWWPLVWVMMSVLWLRGICGWPVFLGIAASIPLHVKECRNVARVQASGDWLSLDEHGHLVRKMYLLCGISLVVGIMGR